MLKEPTVKVSLSHTSPVPWGQLWGLCPAFTGVLSVEGSGAEVLVYRW